MLNNLQVYLLTDNGLAKRPRSAPRPPFYLVTQDMMSWAIRVANWGQILLQLSVFFPDRVNTQLS